MVAGDSASAPYDPNKLGEHIESYLDVRDVYAALGKFLHEVFDRTCRQIDPLAAVSHRTKWPASFAEKCVRWRYSAPLTEMYDLCGTRAIMTSPEGVQRVKALIRDHLTVRSSEDRAERLAADKFGYLSVHFIVTVPLDIENPPMNVEPHEGESVRKPLVLTDAERKLRDALLTAIEDAAKKQNREGFAVPLVAEIQVRTQLQHAWADAFHDRAYKTKFKVPRRYEREVSRLAAVLEEADVSLARVARALDAYQIDYGAYSSRKEMEAELQTLKLLFDAEKLKNERPEHALRIAKVAKALGDWSQVADVTGLVLQSQPARKRLELLVENGNAQCRAEGGNVAAGQKALELALADPGLVSGEIRARALAWLARSERQQGREDDARRHASEACNLDPTNPYHLKAFVESELAAQGTADVTKLVRLASGEIQRAIATCREHAEVRAELPYAYFALGFFLLLIDGDIEALPTYAKGIASSGTAHPIADELKTVDLLLNRLGPKAIPKLGDVRLLLLLGATGRATKPDEKETYRSALRATFSRIQHRSSGKPVDVDKDLQLSEKEPVVMLVGGAAHADVTKLAGYEAILGDAFESFSGVVFCGGTQQGIPGCLGRVAAKQGGHRRLDLVAYVPKNLPSDATLDQSYRHFEIDGASHFSYREALQSWAHILVAGIAPETVRVLGINGGVISRLEYYVGLALGATVGLVANSGREAAALLNEEPWWPARRVFELPEDGATARAYLYSGEYPVPGSKEEFAYERAAERVHDLYNRDNPPMATPWAAVEKDFKVSSRHQVQYAPFILKACGFDVRPRTDASGLIPGSDFFKSRDEVDRMAKLEHGRWNLERFAQGWRWGEKTDKAAKIHKDLVPWEKLDETERGKDRQAVLHFPEVLWEAGFEVFRKGDK